MMDPPQYSQLLAVAGVIEFVFILSTVLSGMFAAFGSLWIVALLVYMVIMVCILTWFFGRPESQSGPDRKLFGFHLVSWAFIGLGPLLGIRDMFFALVSIGVFFAGLVALVILFIRVIIQVVGRNNTIP